MHWSVECWLDLLMLYLFLWIRLVLSGWNMPKSNARKARRVRLGFGSICLCRQLMFSLSKLTRLYIMLLDIEFLASLICCCGILVLVSWFGISLILLLDYVLCYIWKNITCRHCLVNILISFAIRCRNG